MNYILIDCEGNIKYKNCLTENFTDICRKYIDNSPYSVLNEKLFFYREKDYKVLYDDGYVDKPINKRISYLFDTLYSGNCIIISKDMTEKNLNEIEDLLT